MSSQYTDGGVAQNASDYASLSTYYDYKPMVGAGVSVVSLQSASRPYLDGDRQVNMKFNASPYRSGYATLSGPDRMSSNGGGGGDYFPLDSAYQSR